METTIEGNIVSDDSKRSFQESNTAKKLDSIFKKKIKNNFKNIEPLSQMDISYNTKQQKPKTKQETKTEGFKSDFFDAVDHYSKEEQEADKKRTKKFFNDMGLKMDSIQGKELKKPEGWRKLFEIIIYFVPGIIKLITKRVTQIEILRSETQDPKNDNTYKDYQKKDAEWLTESGYEFCQIFLAAYFASAMYYRLLVNDTPKEPEIMKYLYTGQSSIDNFLHGWIFVFLLFLPNTFHFLIYDILKFKVVKHINQFPTICYLFFYFLSLFFCSFFLDKLVQMFLDVFEFKANPLIYVFVVFGFIAYITNLDLKNKILSTILNIFYIIYIILHLLFSITLAPIAQLIFTIYMLLFFSGGPTYVIAFVKGLINGRSIVSERVSESEKSDLSFWGNFDNFLYKYVYKNFFAFMLLIFFFYKALHSLIPPTNLKIYNLKLGVGFLNGCATIGLLLIYIAGVFKDVKEDLVVQVQKNNNVQPNKPVATPTNLQNNMFAQPSRTTVVQSQPEVQSQPAAGP